MSGTVKSVVALHDILREFETVPSDHVETTMIEFEFDTSNQFCLDGDVVVAPRVIAADQVSVRKLPPRARPGVAHAGDGMCAYHLGCCHRDHLHHRTRR
jgi:hypothetical protein